MESKQLPAWRERRRRPDWDAVSLALILIATAVAYWPMVRGIIRLGARTNQALNAFILLSFAVLDAVREVRRQVRFQARIDTFGIGLFALACMALAASAWHALWPLAVLALCLNLAALLAFGFGRAGVAAFAPALAGFGIAAAMLILAPRLDLPLRVLSAGFSGKCLSWLGVTTQIAVRDHPFTMVLVIETGKRAFEVAAECNGFGIILSALLLMVVYAMRAHYRWFVVLGLGLLGVAIGMAFNVLRIVAICVVSLRVSLRYALIHEGLGTAIYLLALAAVYLVAAWPRWPRRRPVTRENDCGRRFASGIGREVMEGRE